MSNILSRLTGTFQDVFGIGKNGVKIKNSGGNLHVRNDSDTAFSDLASKSAKLQGNNAANGVTITAPDSLGSNVTLILPSNSGASGQALITDGTGTLTFQDVSSDADKTVSIDFDQATTSPATLLTPSQNWVIKEITIVVDTAAGSGTPSLTVGIAGDTDLYVAPGDLDLLNSATYIVDANVELTAATPDDIIVTITPSGQTFSGKIYITYAV